MFDAVREGEELPLDLDGGLPDIRDSTAVPLIADSQEPPEVLSSEGRYRGRVVGSRLCGLPGLEFNPEQSEVNITPTSVRREILQKVVVEAGFNVHQLVESVLIRDKIFPALGPRLPILPHPDSVVVGTPGRSGQVRSGQWWGDIYCLLTIRPLQSTNTFLPCWPEGTLI